jgi:galactose oxidase
VTVTYAPGKILYIGGGNDPTNKIPSAACEVINFGQNDAAWRPTTAMSKPRRQHNATLLPDGTVLVTGGAKGGGFDDGFNDLSEGQPVHEAELWNPVARGGERGSAPAAANTIRTDSRFSARAFTRARRFSIHLTCFAAPDPRSTRHPGSEFIVRFSGVAPVRATIVKPGSVTHSMDANQRFVELEFKITGQQRIAVTLPADPADWPPGFYMLFLLSADGVPSVAHHANRTGFYGGQHARHSGCKGGTRVVAGLTSRCPYGLAACWGGAYQTLKALEGVDAVKAVANAEDSTAEVFLTSNGPPDVDSWQATFRDMAKGSYDFRGVEVTLTGTVRLESDGLTFSGPGWSIRLDSTRPIRCNGTGRD